MAKTVKEEEYIITRGDAIITNFSDKTKAVIAFDDCVKKNPPDGRPSKTLRLWKQIKIKE